MTGSPADEYRQSATACCPRETIPDSCSCPDGCACLCADCECDDMAEFFEQWPETPQRECGRCGSTMCEGCYPAPVEYPGFDLPGPNEED